MAATKAYLEESLGCENRLAPYAVNQESSPGRRFSEAPCITRTEFQRDRDRIIHSTAFRRLEYKTQVFINHEGDLYRTRLTHTLEVAQIARSIARSLQLNEDLTEAIALAHDLGHTAFGHAGQDALHECMKEFGGFEHNYQSLRVVDELEEKYPDFDGLNLMFDTREGILKHCSIANARKMGELGRRFIDRKQPSLEAQLTNIADEIAYNNHDVDDGLRSGLISIDQLLDIEIFNVHYSDVSKNFSSISEKRKAHEVIRRIINQLVTDLITQARHNLQTNEVSSLEDVRNMNKPLISFSTEIKEKTASLKTFLNKNLYQHSQVDKMSSNAKDTIRQLFDAFYSAPDLLPKEHKLKAEIKQRISGKAGLARVVADYIAGMTDRYAHSEHQRVTQS